ncbi:MAG: UDP-glucose/GDP-mannose dehydrogenase family protein [Bacteroidales bacterium]
MKVIVVGSGYVGLVTGTCLAETGIKVHCVDIDQTKIQKLNQGIIPIYEPGLETLVKKNIKEQRLFFTTSLKDVLKGADAVFIAVGTPPDEDGSADLRHVLAVAREVGKHIEDYMVVITKSTVPVGTAKKVKQAVQDEITARGVQVEFDVASNPEFLKEGAAIDDFMKPERIVIGIESKRAEELLSRLYKPFVMNGHPIIFMNIPSAELTKYAANAMLATRISFMNEIANLCDILGADVTMVRKGIGSDSRIGSKFLYSGVGYGGSCFPKDVKALIKTAKDNGYSLEVLDAVERVNDKQKSVLFNKILSHYNGSIQGKKFALWGLSFKPNTDDMREAPSIVMVEKLTQAGAKIVAFDPVAMEEAKHRISSPIEYASNQYDALTGCDALIIITEWQSFRLPDFELIQSKLKEPVIFDGRNIYEPQEIANLGFSYYSIGRDTVFNEYKNK